MAEFDITKHSRKVAQMKKAHDDQIELLHQKLAKEVEQLHAEIPAEHKNKFDSRKNSKGRTGLTYPIARRGVAEPDWYQDVIQVLDRATTDPSVTFKDLQTVTGVKQPGNLLKHLMQNQKTDKVWGDEGPGTGTIPAKQFGGEKVITTGRFQPGTDYTIDRHTGAFKPLPMLGMPMFYKGKQIHLFPELEAKFAEYMKKKMTKDFRDQFKPLESVEHMKQLIQLVESASKQKNDPE